MRHLVRDIPFSEPLHFLHGNAGTPGDSLNLVHPDGISVSTVAAMDDPRHWRPRTPEQDKENQEKEQPPVEQLAAV